jgi:hypothetical protein
MFGVLIEDLSVKDLPQDLTGTRPAVRLAAGRDHVMLRVVLPVTHEEAHVTFSAEDLQRLKCGLEEARLDAKYFAWPPLGDSDRPPDRGLPRSKPRMPAFSSAATARSTRRSTDCAACERLRRQGLLVILGASGTGKSSFPRAGLFPRLKRDDRTGARLATSSRFRFVGGHRRELHGLPTN